MRRIWPFVALLVFGCSPSEPPTEQSNALEQMGGSESATTSEGSSGVGVTSPALGGASPVTGGESVGGGGMGGVGQAAKDAARGAASKAGGSSVNQADSGE
ncbi:MAG: hypothetical protein KF884_11500 [Fimbriimonadaceae bacterium]|nr:hypothetical protein [Fimbriimonadaceae bacterium]QYK58168.1 MAG: hypothetical protein KF884_11500 [Fimbriimonadaceae bacterium]